MPSAEHVTMTAGMPLSSTGRISAGRRVALMSASGGGTSRVPAPGPGVCRYTSRTSNSTARRGLRTNAFKKSSGASGIQRPDVLHEPLANAGRRARHPRAAAAGAQIPPFELIGLVRRKLLDRERNLAVVLERLDQAGRELLRDECRHRSAVGVDAASRTLDAREVRDDGRACRRRRRWRTVEESGRSFPES